MPTPFPHHYDTTLTWLGAGPAALGSEGRPTITGGAPPEFDGQREWWSPEHLLLSSLNLCLQATFEALARKARVHVDSYRSHATATLAPIPDGLGFTYLALEVEIVARPEDEARVRDLMTTAKHHCIVARALMPPVHMSVAFMPAPARPLSGGH
jgi:organic hydroperoxide reductase OsmC/OhrA